MKPHQSLVIDMSERLVRQAYRNVQAAAYYNGEGSKIYNHAYEVYMCALRQNVEESGAGIPTVEELFEELKTWDLAK